MEDGNRQQRQKKCKIIFLKNIIFFFLFCILTKNRKSPADEKSSAGQMHVSLNSRSCATLHSALRLRLSASARLGYIYSGNEGISLSYQFILMSNQYGETSNKAAKMPHKTGGISAIQNQIASDTRFAGYLFEALLRIETPPILRKLCNDLIRWKRKL